MSRKPKGAVIIIAFILFAVCLGFIYNALMNIAERKSHPQKYSDTVVLASQKYGVPSEIIYAVIKTESDFDANSESSASAFGLMQITVGAYEDMTGKVGSNDTLKNLSPEENIDIGTHYLAWLYSCLGDWNTVFAAYNAGIGNVKDWLADSRYSEDGKTLSAYPSDFGETRVYVRKVSDAVNTYMRLYSK